MNRIHSFLINGEVVDVPENELEEFLATFRDSGFDIQEQQTYEIDGDDGAKERVQVPESEREEFLQTFGANGVEPRQMHRVQMNDGMETYIGDAQAKAYVDARKNGAQMSRGLLRTAGIPDWYGKTVADREGLADEMLAWYPQVEVAPPMQEQGMEGVTEDGVPWVKYTPDKYDANLTPREETPSNMGILQFDPTNLNGAVSPEIVLRDEPGGMLDYLKTAKEAEYGRELNGLEATAANTPIVGTVMDSNEKRTEDVLRRLYKGEYRDSLEASKLALSIGYTPEQVKAVNDAANAEPPEEAYGEDGEFKEDYSYDPEASMRNGFANLVSGDLAKRIETKQKKGDKISKFDLNILQKAGVGAAGLAKTALEMFNIPTALATLAPSAMNRASDMSEGMWTTDVNGEPVEVMKGEDKATALAKGVGSAAVERAVWMNPWMGKFAGKVAQKMGGGIVANNAMQAADMALKNDITDLVDNVVGLNTSDVNGGKSLGQWAEDHFMPQNLARDLVDSAIAHLGMKGMRLATKSGREALAKEIYAEIARRGEMEQQKALKSINEATLEQQAREDAKTRYNANLSEEAGWNMDKTAEELVGADPELKFRVIDRATKRAKDRAELEDPVRQRELVEQAAVEIGDEVAREERMAAGDANEARIIDQAATAEAREAKRGEVEDAFKAEEVMEEPQKVTETPEVSQEKAPEAPKTEAEVSEIDAEPSKIDADAGFRAWATGRDGKPLVFETPEEEAQSRKTFEMLVKQGTIDPATGQMRPSVYQDVPETRRDAQERPVETPEAEPVESSAEAQESAPRAENEGLVAAAKVLKTDAYLPEKDLRAKLAIWKKNVSSLGGARKEKMQAQIDAAEQILAARKTEAETKVAAETPTEATKIDTTIHKFSDTKAGGRKVSTEDIINALDNAYEPSSNKEKNILRRQVERLTDEERIRYFDLLKEGSREFNSQEEEDSWEKSLNEFENSVGVNADSDSTEYKSLAKTLGEKGFRPDGYGGFVKDAAEYATVPDGKGKKRLTGIAAQKKAAAEEETRQRRAFIEDRHPRGMMAFLEENGPLMGKPSKKRIQDAISRRVRFVYDDQVAGDALDNFFDGMSGAEKSRWERILFKSNKNRTSSKTQGDGAEQALKEYFFDENMTIDKALDTLRREIDGFEEFKRNGGKTTAELENEYLEEEARAREVKIDGESYDIEDIENRKAFDDVYNNASAVVTKFDSGSPEVKMFGRDELSKVKKGDTIRFDHQEEEFVVDKDFDAKRGEITVTMEGQLDNPLLSDAEKAELRGMRFRITKDGWIELKENKNGTESKNREGADGSLVGDAQGKSGERAEDFKLEAATAEEIEAEKKRQADREEIARRQAAPLKTGKGEIGQELPDLGGAEGGDLFNRENKTNTLSAPKEGTVAASLTDEQARKILGEEEIAPTPSKNASGSEKPLEAPPQPLQGSQGHETTNPFYDPQAGYGAGVEKPIHRREVLNMVGDLFKGLVAIRGKNTTQMPSWAAGHFEPNASIIRSKDPNSLKTIPHEIGHFIHYLYEQGNVRGKGLQPFSADVGADLVKMGHALYGNKKPNGGYQREGMAELMKFWMQGNEAGLKKDYPHAYNWLTKDFAKAHPDVMAKLEKIRDAVDRYTNQSAEQAVAGAIVPKKGILGRAIEKIGNAIEAVKPTQEKWIDSNAFITKGIRAAKMDKLVDWQGALERGDVAEAQRIIKEHPMFKAKLYNGKAGARAFTSLRDGLTDLSGTRRYTYADAGITPPQGKKASDAIPSMRDIFQTFNAKELDDFQKYAIARVFKENYGRKNLETGVSKEAVDRFLNLPQYKNNTKFERALKDWTDYNHSVLHLLVDSGAINKEMYDKIVANNTIYTKIMRHEESRGLFKDALRKSGGRAVNKRVGSNRQVEDLFEATLIDHEKIIGAAMQADLLRSMVKLGKRAEQIGTKGGMSVAPNWIHEVPNAKERVSVSAKKMKDAVEKKLGTSDPELDRIIDALTNGGQENEAFSIFRDRASNGKDNLVSIYDQEGNLHTYELPEVNGQAWADGLMGFTKSDRDGVLMKLAKIATSGVRSGATMLNPEFAVRNLVRDALHGSVLNEYGVMLPGEGTLEGIAMDLLNTDTKRLYEQMNLNMGTFLGTSKLDTARKQANVLKARSGFEEQLNKGIVKTLADIVGFSENGTRIKEFKLVRDWALKNGLDEQAANTLAGCNALDITVDFQRAGNLGRKLNKQIVFLNAGIQGLDQFGRSLGLLRAQPWQRTQGSVFEKGTRSEGFKRMGRTFLKGAANLTTLSLGSLAYNMSDEERWKKWKNLPAHEKWNYISFGDTRLPVPFELGYAFMSIPTAVAAEMSGDKGAIVECLATFAKSLPIQTGSGHDIARNFTLAAPLVDVLANEDWKGSEIVPKRKKDNSPAWEWYGPKTSQMAILIGRTIAKAGESAGLDMSKNALCSPAYIQTIMDGYSGGMFSRLSKGATNISRGDVDISLDRKHELPIVGTFFRRPNTSRVVNDFYDRAETLTKKYNDMTFDGATPEEYGEKVVHDEITAKLSPIWNDNKAIIADDSLKSRERNDRIDANIEKAQKIIEGMKIDKDKMRTLGLARAAASLTNPNVSEAKSKLDANVLKKAGLEETISALRAYGNEVITHEVKNSRGYKTGRVKRERRWTPDTIRKRIRELRRVWDSIGD